MAHQLGKKTKEPLAFGGRGESNLSKDLAKGGAKANRAQPSLHPSKPQQMTVTLAVWHAHVHASDSKHLGLESTANVLEDILCRGNNRVTNSCSRFVGIVPGGRASRT